jgi:hypothetical protein
MIEEGPYSDFYTSKNIFLDILILKIFYGIEVQNVWMEILIVHTNT